MIDKAKSFEILRATAIIEVSESHKKLQQTSRNRNRKRPKKPSHYIVTIDKTGERASSGLKNPTDCTSSAATTSQIALPAKNDRDRKYIPQSNISGQGSDHIEPNLLFDNDEATKWTNPITHVYTKHGWKRSSHLAFMDGAKTCPCSFSQKPQDNCPEADHIRETNQDFYPYLHHCQSCEGGYSSSSVTEDHLQFGDMPPLPVAKKSASPCHDKVQRRTETGLGNSYTSHDLSHNGIQKPKDQDVEAMIHAGSTGTTAAEHSNVHQDTGEYAEAKSVVGQDNIEILVSRSRERHRYVHPGEVVQTLFDDRETLESQEDAAMPSVMRAAPDRSDEVQCTFCEVEHICTARTPAVLCPYCADRGNVKYCSISCLLVDSFKHNAGCLNTSHGPMPDTKLRTLLADPLYSVTYDAISNEQYRQRTFIMHTRGLSLIPQLLDTWIHRPGNSSRDLRQRPSGKCSILPGSYFVFKSSLWANHRALANPDASILCSIVLDPGSRLHEYLTRSLNVLFLFRTHAVAQFVYRLIRSTLRDPGLFGTFDCPEYPWVVEREFMHQFWMEFGFAPVDEEMQWITFDLDLEWDTIMHGIVDMERLYTPLMKWGPRSPEM